MKVNTGGSSGLYYRVGQLGNPAGGDYTIAWSSGSTGVKYDDGVNPHIAINNQKQVVEVHQVGYRLSKNSAMCFDPKSCATNPVVHAYRRRCTIDYSCHPFS
jgi:hypothetical protein